MTNKFICVEDALKYTTKKKWRENSNNLYLLAWKNKWLNECTAHMNSNKPKGYWNNFELCKVEALKYNLRSQFKKKSSSAYHNAWTNNWLDKCCAHMEILSNSHKRLIYSLEFPDKHVYVGLTYNPIERKKYHFKNSKSPVYKHIKKTKTKPKFLKQTNFINRNIASNKEGEILKIYENNGWTILNKIKTGGLGGDILIWTKEKCIETAKNFISKMSWKKAHCGAYQSALRNGWLNECTNHMISINKPKYYWTLDRCIIESKKYQTKKEWSLKSFSSYKAAWKREWLDECCKHMY
jgi:hypothetical protein